jgi:sugar phosphate isomerase/epimerase
MPILDTNSLAVVAAALDSDVRNAARISRQLGFAGLLLDATMPGLNLTELSQSGRRELASVLRSENQRLAAIRFDLGPTGITPRTDLDKLLARLDKVLDAAASLGSGLLCVDAGPLPMPDDAAGSTLPPAVAPATAGQILLPSADDLRSLVGISPPSPAAPKVKPDPAGAANVAAVDTAIAEIANRADRYSVAVAMSSELSSFAAIARILNRYDARHLAVDLDAVALVRDRWSLDETLSALGPRIRHVRLRNAAVGADRRTAPVPIGRGSAPLAALVSGLIDGGYGGMFTVDTMELPDRLAAAAAARRFLISL